MTPSARRIAALSGRAAEVTDGWVIGRQFDPSLQAGPDELNTELLDPVSDTVPVVVVNASGHFAYVNSAALRAAGIDRDTPDIDGSPYGRYPDGTPDGVLKGQPAMLSVLALNPDLATLDINAAARAVGERAARVGITTICDQGTGFLTGPRRHRPLPIACGQRRPVDPPAVLALRPQRRRLRPGRDRARAR